MSLYLPRNHKGTFYYRDRFWSFDNEFDPYPVQLYCQYCAAPEPEFISIVKGSYVLTCANHKGPKPMALSEEQRKAWEKIFCDEKEVLAKHPYINEDGSINREACLAYQAQLAEAEFMLRTKQQAVVWALEDAIKNKSEAEKKQIREFDKTHKFKSGIEVEREKAEKRKADGGLSKEEKLILSVMQRLNCSRDKAVAWIEADI